MPKKILQKESPVLRKIASSVPIEEISSTKIKKILEEMRSALDSQDDGVAIAAPQIGYSMRIFMVSKKVEGIIAEAKNHKKVPENEKAVDAVFINPVIKRLSKEKKVVEEGCLSVRYLYGEVSRSTKATVVAYDENGKKFERGGTGLLAQIFQHEVDHLNGILFIDKAKNVEEIFPENQPEPLSQTKMNNPHFVFFGTGDVSVHILDTLKNSGYIPSLVVTMPDKPRGRKFIMTPPEAKVWAENNGIKVLQPEKLNDDLINELRKESWDVFIVVAYGKIIPKAVLEISAHGSLNIHYSLLPKLRGSAPVEGAILADEKETGVTIILMDQAMDHGPIIAQEKMIPATWPLKRTDLMKDLNDLGGKLLVETLPKWLDGELTPTEQDHEKATVVKMIKKEDALIDLSADDYLNYKKIMAYEAWPRSYFIQNGKRVIINSAEWKDGKLNILRVTPEGKKEMDYKSFRNQKDNNLDVGI